MALLCLPGCSRETADTLEVFAEGQANQVDGQTGPASSPTTAGGGQNTAAAEPFGKALPLPNPLGLLGLDVATSDCDIQNDPYDTCI